LRLWATIKQYSVEEVGQCYWSTPDDDYEEDPTLSEPYPYESLPLEPLFGQQLDPLVIQQAMTNVQINHYNIQPSYILVNKPWWLPLLETLSQHLLDEHNNFSPNYLCNSVW